MPLRIDSWKPWIDSWTDWWTHEPIHETIFFKKSVRCCMNRFTTLLYSHESIHMRFMLKIDFLKCIRTIHLCFPLFNQVMNQFIITLLTLLFLTYIRHTLKILFTQSFVKTSLIIHKLLRVKRVCELWDLFGVEQASHKYMDSCLEQVFYGHKTKWMDTYKSIILYQFFHF
jgi:hypothetical protein